jgi:sec-independent protein translocase protein TatC
MIPEESKLAKAFNVVKDSRRRFISSIVVVLLCCAFSLIFGNRVIIFFESLAPAGTQFVAYQLEANFEIYVQVALYSGVILASPYLLYQVIRSLTPVLGRKQKVYLFTFLPLIIIFFVLGVVYTTYVFMPLTLKFALGFVTQISTGITPMVDLGKYISFLTKIYVMIGLAFELPVIMYILSKFGLVSHTWLAKKWRWGILGSAVIAALVTPTGDVFHDGLKDLLLMDCGFSVSVPIFFLYFLSIFMAWMGRKPKPVEIFD